MYSDLIKLGDFKGYGLITAHCNLAKLDIAINFAKSFKLDELLCYGFMADIIEKWKLINALEDEEIPDDLKPYYDLIFGADYPDCKDRIKNQQGIKVLWIYYAYAEYVRTNPMDDTPNGLVVKSNDHSMPLSIGEINTLSFKYENMAKTIFHNIRDYLCTNKDFFTKFDSCDCQLDCGCSGKCSCGKIKKVTGFKFKVVRKK